MELFLYSNIYDFTAEQLNSALVGNENESLTLRVNCNGGETNSGTAIVTAISRHKGAKKMYADGAVKSYAAFLTLFFPEVVSSEMAEFLLHKAAYPSWYEPKENEVKELDSFNNAMEDKLRKRLAPAYMWVADKVFEKDKRNDVSLTAKEAKEAGLVSEIITLDVEALKAAHYNASVKMAEFISDTSQNKESNKNQIKINKVMTFEELKSQHPELYKQAVAVGRSEEKDRVAAFALFLDVKENSVNEYVKNAIVNGDTYNNVAGASIQKLTFAENTLKKAEDENTKEVVVPESDKEKDAEELNKTKTPEEIAEAKKEAVNRLSKMF